MIQLPSVELLGQVLKRKLYKHDPSFLKIEDSAYEGQFNAVHINYLDSQGRMKGYLINVYELLYLCKVWACSQGYQIFSHFGGYVTCYVYRDTPKNIIGFEEFNADATDEPEAVFKVCNWINNE